MAEAARQEAARVLVALDGSEAAATALPVARSVAAQLSAEMGVLHATYMTANVGELRHRLGLESGELQDVPIITCEGEPVPCIVDHTREPGVLLVVLTTHGMAIEPGRHLGRVAEAVVKRSTRPILLVRPEAAAVHRVGPGPIKRLLLPLDGSPATAAALEPAFALAARLGASADVLYVASPKQVGERERGSMSAPRYVDQPQHEWPQWASELVDRLCASCGAEIPVRVYLRQGDIGSEIALFAAEQRYDAVVLVLRSRLEPGRARVLRAVLDNTSCPILLVGAPLARP